MQDLFKALKRAHFDRLPVSIGGSDFSREEVAALLDQMLELFARDVALEAIQGVQHG